MAFFEQLLLCTMVYVIKVQGYCLYNNKLGTALTYNPHKQNQKNTTRWANVSLMLVQRRKRWTNNKPTLGERLVFAGNGFPLFYMYCIFPEHGRVLGVYYSATLLFWWGRLTAIPPVYWLTKIYDHYQINFEKVKNKRKLLGETYHEWSQKQP